VTNEPRCYARACKHFIGMKGNEPDQHPVCPAYPDRIPDRIVFGDDPHIDVARDQVGLITYERDTTV
jgi:hypothetical protein